MLLDIIVQPSNIICIVEQDITWRYALHGLLGVQTLSKASAAITGITDS